MACMVVYAHCDRARFDRSSAAILCSPSRSDPRSCRKSSGRKGRHGTACRGSPRALIRSSTEPQAGQGQAPQRVHRAVLQASAKPAKAVVFEFCEIRNGQGVREFVKLGTASARACFAPSARSKTSQAMNNEVSDRARPGSYWRYSTAGSSPGGHGCRLIRQPSRPSTTA